MAWWANKEDPEERKLLHNHIDKGNADGSVASRPSLNDVLLKIIHVFNMHNRQIIPSRLWCVGTDFDVAMLRYLYNKLDNVGAYPFGYRAARDLRTFCDAMNVDREEVEMADGLKKHNALDDAIHCANVVQYAYQNRHVKDVNDYM
jgi:hypothetical protein